MTTRAFLSNGDTFDIDEETEARFTHLDGSTVLRWEYVGPTPPRPVKPQDVAARRAELLAELDALGVDQPAGAAEAPVDPAELAQLRADVAALAAQLRRAGAAAPPAGMTTGQAS
jgi:hypothetical protein